MGVINAISAGGAAGMLAVAKALYGNKKLTHRVFATGVETELYCIPEASEFSDETLGGAGGQRNTATLQVPLQGGFDFTTMKAGDRCRYDDIEYFLDSFSSDNSGAFVTVRLSMLKRKQ